MDAHPEYLRSDGVHQVTTPIELANEVANAVVGLYRDGWTQCRQRLDQLAATTTTTSTTTTTTTTAPVDDTSTSTTTTTVPDESSTTIPTTTVPVAP